VRWAQITETTSTWSRRRQRVAVASVAIAVVLVLAAIASDIKVRVDLAAANGSLDSAHSQIAISLQKLASVEGELTSVTGQRDALQNALSTTSAELTRADKGLFIQGASLAALNTCLAGVEQALNQIAVGDQSGAVASISAVSASCQVLEGGNTGGPVYPFDFPDPFLLRVNNVYYGYATNSAAGNIQIIRSGDLVHWQGVGNALPHLAPWALPNGTWAPGVIERNGTFVMYYSAIFGITGEHCISAAVATQPQGPFIDNSSAPIACQLDQGGSIDPSPYIDTSGRPYLTWKSEGLNGSPPTIWAQQLNDGGTATVGNAVPLLRPSQPWEAGVVEGPAMQYWSGQYYLFFSANNWNTASYAIGATSCSGPLGPCAPPPAAPLLDTQGPVIGPGGPTLVTDTQGGLWMGFHAWQAPNVGFPHNRLLYLRAITFVYGAPSVVPPAGG
jgi:hypothetical protein